MSSQPMLWEAGRHRSVYLVDRHPLMRLAAAEWINRSDGLTVCGMAGRTAKALEEITSLHPAVVVTEILRPHDLDFIKELRRQHPRLPILVFTIQEEALYRERAEAAGASGYLMKRAGGARLVQTIQAVLGQPGQAGAEVAPADTCEIG